MQTLYMKEQIKTLENKVKKLEQTIIRIVEILKNFEGGDKLQELQGEI